ncbi:MAG TPA: hypothetical protein VFW92_09145 [Candidatus Limnocylindrales bacterium]|jgi:hypothetical protein|nr:hypothetical protein [Candidatus Limnocylindrales bacterium]
MPSLVCRTCGRKIFTTAPITALFEEERRCPRCGAYLEPDRRSGPRRVAHRRHNPAQDPGPPESGPERRNGERRDGERRRPENGGGR